MNEFSIRSSTPIFKFLRGSKLALSCVLLNAVPFRFGVSVKTVSGYGAGEVDATSTAIGFLLLRVAREGFRELWARTSEMMKSMYRRLTSSFSRPAKVERYPRVDIFSWQPGDGRINFGDCLAKIVVERVLMSGGRTRHDETVVAKRMLAIGSVVHFAASGDVIWGSGVNGKIPEQMHQFERLDVRAVRGPLTADFLAKRGIQVPKIYGDPGLLIPHLFPRFIKRTADREYSFVPNLHDLEASRHQPNIISPLWGWNVVIDRIIRSEFIVASSLHGLVIAEAYGIPARYVRLSPSEDIFKYEDYYYGTGRENFTFAKSIKEALEMGGMPPPVFDHQRLLDAFPWDLWSVPEKDEIPR